MRGFNLSKRANKRTFKKNALRTHVKNASGHTLMRGGTRLV